MISLLKGLPYAPDNLAGQIFIVVTPLTYYCLLVIVNITDVRTPLTPFNNA